MYRPRTGVSIPSKYSNLKIKGAPLHEDKTVPADEAYVASTIHVDRDKLIAFHKQKNRSVDVPAFEPFSFDKNTVFEPSRVTLKYEKGNMVFYLQHTNGLSALISPPYRSVDDIVQDVMKNISVIGVSNVSVAGTQNDSSVNISGALVLKTPYHENIRIGDIIYVRIPHGQMLTSEGIVKNGGIFFGLTTDPLENAPIYRPLANEADSRAPIGHKAGESDETRLRKMLILLVRTAAAVGFVKNSKGRTVRRGVPVLQKVTDAFDFVESSRARGEPQEDVARRAVEQLNLVLVQAPDRVPWTRLRQPPVIRYFTTTAGADDAFVIAGFDGGKEPLRAIVNEVRAREREFLNWNAYDFTGVDAGYVDAAAYFAAVFPGGVFDANNVPTPAQLPAAVVVRQAGAGENTMDRVNYEAFYKVLREEFNEGDPRGVSLLKEMGIGMDSDRIGVSNIVDSDNALNTFLGTEGRDFLMTYLKMTPSNITRQIHSLMSSIIRNRNSHYVGKVVRKTGQHLKIIR